MHGPAEPASDDKPALQPDAAIGPALRAIASDILAKARVALTDPELTNQTAVARFPPRHEAVARADAASFDATGSGVRTVNSTCSTFRDCDVARDHQWCTTSGGTCERIFRRQN
jgi:hypothetical protein